MPTDRSGEVTAARSEHRLTTTTWTQLRAPSGVALPSSDQPVVAVFAAFVRNINPLQYSRRFGNQLYESPEHEAMTDGLLLHLSPTTTITATDLMSLSSNVQVSYSQVIALAGDFYGVPDAPISDGTSDADRQQRFKNAFGTLDGDNSGNVQNILAVMDEQSAVINAAVGNLTGSDRYSQAYTKVNDGHAYDRLYNAASGGASDGTLWFLSQGSYLKLAATNWDHFGNHAIAAYKAGHAVALAQAAQAGSADPSQRETMMQRAYLMEAFACHFLADLFSAGHLRTPRKALHDPIDPVPDLLSQMMHDEDSYNGLVGSSSTSAGWVVYGDKRMLDQDNATNLANARAALSWSATEVYQQSQDPTRPIVPANFIALTLIPTLAPLLDRNNKQNWPELFYRDDDDANDSSSDPSDVNFRVPVTDLDSTTYMGFDTLGGLLLAAGWFTDTLLPLWLIALTNPYQHLAYLVIWWATPSGGTHSLEGAPPAWLSRMNALAHPFTWQASYALKNTSNAFIPNAEAPAATVAVSRLVGGDTPLETPTHANDMLHVFFRQDNTNGVMHLTTPMSNVVNQQNAGAWSPGCDVATLNLNTNGQVAAIDTEDVITLVFPDASGNLRQSVILPQSGLDPTGQRPLFGTVPQLAAQPNATPALINVGEMLFLTYLGADGNLYYATGRPGQGTAYYQWTGTPGVNTPAGTWTNGPKTIAIGGKNVAATDDPSAIFIDNYVYVAVGGRGNGPFPILIYRCLATELATQSWQLYLNGIKDSSGHAIQTQRFAKLFNYGDGYGVVAKDPSTSNLFTAVPLRTYAPTQAWSKRIISVPSPQFTQPQQFNDQGSRTTVSAIFYGGNPYLFFADKTSTDLSLVTSNPPKTMLRS